MNVQFLAIQESKMSTLKMFRLRSLWGNLNFDYAVALSQGFSGGIISLWDPNVFVRSDLWCDNNFVIVKGKWLRENIEVYMVNVYAPQDLSDKIILWNKLSDFMNAHLGDYICMGDWNAVRSMEDRCGSEFVTNDAIAFNDFIDSNQLHEVSPDGLQFTWRNKVGSKLSKIDRFFISYNVLNMLDDITGLVLPRGESDHSPIMLFQKNLDFGPTNFKIYDSWFARSDFVNKIREI
ncbi:uncharacterized protein [Rutidosis leptorrhynchoides]|uniref:uncharacterized protein n=1 Tax=Rutidosis leptorrhynchoides TaxID=125765 RepID=UPI003A9A0008